MLPILQLTEIAQQNRLKYLNAALEDSCSSDSPAYKYYTDAIANHDFKKITFFEQFGDTPRHQLTNLASYFQARKFGFNNLTINKSGWLESPVWLQKLCFRLLPTDDDNKVVLAEGNNHKWTYGISMWFPGEGFSFSPSIYGEIFNTKDACLCAAIYRFKHELQRKSFTHAESVRLTKTLSTALETLLLTQNQLSLF